MSTPEEKREKKALYNKNHREKKKLEAQKSTEEKPKAEIKEIEVIEEQVIEEQEEEQPEEEPKVSLSRADYEWLIEQVQKQTLTKPEEKKPENIIPVVEPPKQEGFFFRLQTSIKNQMISSIASMGSVLALSLAIRGSQSLIQSMNKSSDKSHISTKSNSPAQALDDMFMPRIVNVG